MRLFKPLELTGTKTLQVQFTPTKDFFKPVLVLNSLLDIETARQLCCDYLFDAKGNPRHFEGTHKLSGQLDSPKVELNHGTTLAVDVAAQKVTKMSCSINKAGEMELTTRVHLVEMNDSLKLAQLMELLNGLNKAEFAVLVTDTTTLNFGDPEKEKPAADGTYKYPKPKADGMYPLELCEKKTYDSPLTTFFVYTLEVAEGTFVGGSSANWKRKETSADFPSKESKLYPSAMLALEEAAARAWTWWTNVVTPKGVKEIADHEAVKVFLIGMCPALARAGYRPLGTFEEVAEEVKH